MHYYHEFLLYSENNGRERKSSLPPLKKKKKPGNLEKAFLVEEKSELDLIALATKENAKKEANVVYSERQRPFLQERQNLESSGKK